MFDSLKKKLKNVIERVSRKITEEAPLEEKIEEKPEPKIPEEIKEENKEKLEPEVEKELKKEPEKIEKEAPAIIEEEKKKIEEEPKIPEEVKEEKKEKLEPEIEEELEIKEEKKEPEKIEEKKIVEPEPEKEVKKEEALPIIEEEEIKKEPEVIEEKPEIEEKIEVEKGVREEPAIVEEKSEKKISRIGRIKKGFVEKFVKRVKEKRLTENDVEGILRELEVVLLENDVALSVAERICNDLKNDLLNRVVRRNRVEDAIKESLRKALLDVMSQEKIDINEMIEKSEEPFVIVFFGFNGTGKTTTIAKFAHRFKSFRPVLAAGDTFRTASIEQLEEHARRLGVEVVKHGYGADSAAVIFDAVKHAKAVGSKVVLADTAGRSHSNINLMDELKKVCRVNKPDMRILVLDSVTGNDIYDQSKLFNAAVGVDTMILTKTDVYEKGGAALSASHTIEKPILFLGTGQEYGDLKEFVPEEIVNNLLE